MENETLDLDQSPKKEQTYKTIGGWLIIPVIGLVFTPFRMIIGIFNDLMPAVTGENLTVYDDPTSEFYTPALRYILYGEIAINLAIAIFAIVILIYLFNFKAQTPYLYITFAVSNLAFIILDKVSIILLGLGTTDDFFDKGLFQLLIGCFIWVPYFLMSERVKGTFVK